MAGPEKDEELFPFLSEPEAEGAASNQVWQILIVDDEPEVHQATLLALRGVSIEGRQLQFLHAYSAAEARSCLAQAPDLAIVMLDVVMESNDAGLQLIHYIRNELGNSVVRIILRTGQPGYAPEIDTIRSYDINDYKTKTEMTRARLFSSLTSAIRSYWQTHQLEANRRGLEMIVTASAELSKPQGMKRLAEGIVTQLCALLCIEDEGLVCAAERLPGAAPYVLAAAGPCSAWIGHPLDKVPEVRLRAQMVRTLAERQHCFGATTCLYFGVKDERALVTFIDVDRPLSTLDQSLLEVFCANISVAFENTYLYQRINDLAYEDQLLLLPNRNGLLAAIEKHSDQDEVLALVDLDGFADINSVLDQYFGDMVLRGVAERLRSQFSSSVTVARIGGDVFGLLGPGTEVNAEKIMAVFASPFEVGDENLRLSATTGLVKLACSALCASDQLKNAGVSLKHAKSFSRGKAVVFEPNFARAARTRMQLLSRLRVAFSAERLYLAYQPLVHLASGRIVGAESLLRWQTEQGEFISPARFIPLAEQSGLMVPIGDWVTRKSLEFLRRLTALGHHDFKMAVNVSYVQFREPEFVDHFLGMICEYGVNPANVEIELTESVAMDNVLSISQKIARIRAAGVSVSIDDFGMGYSSLHVVRQLEVDCLKIDQAFVCGDSGQKDNFKIAEMIAQLAAFLHLSTTAEGIETETQWQSLLKMGCVNGQGYLFSKALPSDQFELLLQRHAASPVWPVDG
jgi:diguanylate cyclase (GGDEF)-like protein